MKYMALNYKMVVFFNIQAFLFRLFSLSNLSKEGCCLYFNMNLISMCALWVCDVYIRHIFLQVTSAFQFSVIKDGKDDMAVSNVEFHMSQQDSQPAMTSKYVCEGFNFSGDCKVASLCTYKFAKCVLTSVPVETVKAPAPTPAPAAPTPAGPVLRPATTKATTTRPPFRNGK
jgi:hypothetical protein